MFGVLGDDGEAVDALFTGDTLFCGGCGAPFEGTLAGVARNFRRIWHRCGDRTLLFPGHEYSEQLLLEYFGGSQPTPWNPRQFAVLTAALQRARDCRSHDRPTIPVLLGNEVQYNTHFASLHACANVVQDAFRVFSRAVNARAASDDRGRRKRPFFKPLLSPSFSTDFSTSDHLSERLRSVTGFFWNACARGRPPR